MSVKKVDIMMHLVALCQVRVWCELILHQISGYSKFFGFCFKYREYLDVMNCLDRPFKVGNSEKH